MDTKNKSLLKKGLDSINGSPDKMKFLISAILIPFTIMVVSFGYSEYQNRKSLKLESVSQISLIDSSLDPFLSEIKIYRNEIEISNISKIDFRLSNTGRVSISEEEIVRPIKINFNNKPNILSVLIKSKNPKDIQVKIEKNQSVVDIVFDLMNPEDTILFSIYFDTLVTDFEATAGIKNLTLFEVKKFEETNKNRNNINTWYLSFGWFFDLFWFLCFFIFYRIHKQIRRFYNSYPNGYTFVSSFNSFLELSRYVERNFSAFLIDKDVKRIREIIKANLNNYNDSIKEMTILIDSELESQRYSKTAYKIFLFLALTFAIYLTKETFSL
ncbi:hypothetical protein [Leptospira meyeri]|uniref:hypothetical protein n=1 Tax=Leptospira meyeri TaxID=29508 RepID=UPI0002BFB348|nr:hypothetical protein [Leptospira meyeri]EMJ90300.1 hypothetical protein LEP1GSC196_0217 [Leptospira meyeri serovar Semaranga str. Veldrot Semarang 173]